MEHIIYPLKNVERPVRPIFTLENMNNTLNMYPVTWRSNALKVICSR